MRSIARPADTLAGARRIGTTCPPRQLAANLSWPAGERSGSRGRLGGARGAATVASRPFGVEPRRGGAESDCRSAWLDVVAGADGRVDRAAAELRGAGQGATASAMSSCSAWADPASRRKCCARFSALRRAGRAFTCSTRPIRQRSVRWRRHRERTLYLLASKSGTTIEPNSLAAHFRQRLTDSGVRALGRSLRRDYRSGHRARSARACGTVPRRLPQPGRHRRPLLGVVVLRPGAGGADGSGPRGDPRLVAGDACRGRARRLRRDSEPGSRSRPRDRRRRHIVARQADAHRAAGVRRRSGCGSNS